MDSPVSAFQRLIVRLWDTSPWTAVATLRGHEDEVYSLAFSADGRQGIHLIFMTTESRHRSPGFRIPQSDCLIGAGGGEQRAIRREGKSGDPRLMSLQFAHEIAGVSVPELNCRLRKSRAGGEHRGGGRSSQSGDAVGMRG